MIHHFLQFTTMGLLSSAGINGAPLRRDPTGVGLNTTVPINPWLRRGPNTLSLFASRPLPRGEDQPPLPPAYYRATAYAAKPDSPSGEPDREHAKFERPEGDEGPLPLIRELPFVLREAPPSRLWDEAETLKELQEADRVRLRGLVQEFASALQARDLARTMALLQYKTEDTARANHQDAGRLDASIRRQYTTLIFAQPDLAIQSGTPEELDIRAVAGGQVMWLSRGFATPAVVGVSKDYRFTFELFAAKVGGDWRIVR
jgi:hypothetical protein